MSFTKYGNFRQSDRGEIAYGRAALDGMPYRGPRVPLKEEEFEALTDEVRDGHIRVFDLSKPEDAAQLQEIWDRHVNGWYRIVKEDHRWVERDGVTTVLVYCWWYVPFRELATDRLPAGLIAPTKSST